MNIQPIEIFLLGLLGLAAIVALVSVMIDKRGK